ncbi:hypothetical protein MBM_08394 [Drepanopeziza brunnea f. sp. 'multigermtubi' MB_m1]|uniref:Uncharacterized protein n=1 Tax=Marssonina brunnea f. sp. multigermtubi (strain MB_m1) TaxID=1072389 RepID=K1WKA2_MARBU|nr:uncharacterized protein MBM_08394 [Drepanopeziza brunnea f. sp. 'multigermtubi' MB_m1]EKD13311.1 hypothetical protein MBM_08394 [Drepanopeziza brunnea f. sp. 'multigermtubi' MB_m1]
MSIDISEMLTKAYNNILQITIKAVNDTAEPASLVLILLVFKVYPRITYLNPLAPSTITKAEAIKKAMSEVRRLQAIRQVADALNIRNGPFTIKTLALFLQSQRLEKKGLLVEQIKEALRRSSKNRRPLKRYCTEAEKLAQFLTASSDTFLTRKEQTDRELITKLRAESVITTLNEIFEDL